MNYKKIIRKDIFLSNLDILELQVSQIVRFAFCFDKVPYVNKEKATIAGCSTDSDGILAAKNR